MLKLHKKILNDSRLKAALIKTNSLTFYQNLKKMNWPVKLKPAQWEQKQDCVWWSEILRKLNWEWLWQDRERSDISTGTCLAHNLQTSVRTAYQSFILRFVFVRNFEITLCSKDSGWGSSLLTPSFVHISQSCQNLEKQFLIFIHKSKAKN